MGSNDAVVVGVAVSVDDDVAARVIGDDVGKESIEDDRAKGLEL